MVVGSPSFNTTQPLSAHLQALQAREPQRIGPRSQPATPHPTGSVPDGSRHGAPAGAPCQNPAVRRRALRKGEHQPNHHVDRWLYTVALWKSMEVAGILTMMRVAGAKTLTARHT